MLEKAYDPKAVEDRIYKMWEDSGAFKADNQSKKEPFTISMPPPNATGQLHLGHAVMLALEDIFTRFARMQGKEALWLPGTDHAAIATESVVIKKIQKEEKIANPRTKYGREGLVAKIAEFVAQSRGTIRGQVRKMGSSCDWSREAYTMDPILNRCVNEVFVQMHSDGLIYRGERVVNWDTALQTTLADDEIEYKDTEATLYTIQYLSAEQTGGEPVYVATSRPETKLGDNGLVVHPEDERYKHLIGKTFDVQWPRGQKIAVTVIADHTVDSTFGTGVIGLTPFHSKIDYEIWQRHKAEIKDAPTTVIGEDGKMTPAIAGYAGMSIEEARAAFVEDLRTEGRIAKEEKYVQPLSISYRSGKPIEPLPKLQWFIDVNKKVVPWKSQQMSLKEVLLDVVKSKDITIVPDHFEKTYFQWIENLQDWCISRQIWWGHRVPVWYKDGETQPGVKAPDEKGWEQDQDTLDTWFSAALWTWSTLIDPKLSDRYDLSLKDLLAQSPDFKKFHPTNVMETGYDILFFWVARMILMTTYATGQIPFKTVYLHGLIRTRDGKKMSKSHPETVIDPLDMIGNYGADALRLSMIVGQSPGADSRLYEEKIAGYRNFVNKLWNASRFVLMQCEAAGVDPTTINDGFDSDNLSPADKALILELYNLNHFVKNTLEKYELSVAGERLYDVIWNFYCDWYLELSKGSANLQVLVNSLRTILKLLHPFTPFITEELWSAIKFKDSGMLIKEDWPTAPKIDSAEYGQASEALNKVIGVVTAIRKLRADQNVEPSKEVTLIIQTTKWVEFLESQEAHIRRLGKINSLTFVTDKPDMKDTVSAFLDGIEIYLPLTGLVDKDKEKASLAKERENLEKFAKGIEAKLSNADFMAKAPEKLVSDQKAKLQEAQDKIAKISERLQSL